MDREIKGRDILILGILFIIFGYCVGRIPVDRQIAVFCNATARIVDCPFEPDPEYLKIAKLLSERDYDNVTYNCWAFSTDLYHVYAALGYNSSIAYGNEMCHENGTSWARRPDEICRNSTSHAWIELAIKNETVWIEATTGQVIDKDNSNYTFVKYLHPKQRQGKPVN